MSENNEKYNVSLDKFKHWKVERKDNYTGDGWTEDYTKKDFSYGVTVRYELGYNGLETYSISLVNLDKTPGSGKYEEVEQITNDADLAANRARSLVNQVNEFESRLNDGTVSSLDELVKKLKR